MFEGTLLDSSSARRPVLGLAQWIVSVEIGILGFVLGAMKLPVAATPHGTKILLLRAVILGGILMFYSLSVCYAYKDARRQGFHAWLWAAIVIVANLPGFLIYLIYSALETGDWKRATLPIAYTSEVFLVSLAALVPLIYTQALPIAFNLTKPVLPPSRGASQSTPQRDRTRNRAAQANTITDPPIIPTEIRYGVHDEKPMPPDAGPYIPGLPPGIGGSGDGPLIGLFPTNPGPPSLEPKPAESARMRIKVSVGVEAAKLIYGPRPEYPRLAVIARVQGTVRIHAIIGTDGTVQHLTVLSGHPLLIASARDAVANWRYQPTLLNGEPVEVDTEIDVIFKLNN